jgi:hypothetical protein
VKNYGIGASVGPKRKEQGEDMSTACVSQETQGTAEPPTAKTDAVAWQAWIGKSRARERRANARRVKAVKSISAAVLLATAALWSNLAQFDIVIRFVVGIGAMVVMFQAFHAGRYAVAALFGALALLYNPVAPAFSFSSEWQRVVVAVSSIPFISSLVWRDARAT